MIVRLLRTFTFFLFISIVFAYYGDPEHEIVVQSRISAGSAAIGDKIYVFGGEISFDNSQSGHQDDLLILSFTPNGTLVPDTTTPQGSHPCSPCAGYALPDDKTIVAINTEYQSYNISSSNRTMLPAGLGFYDTTSNTWTYPQLSNTTFRSLPTTRTSFTTAISPQSDTIYLIGGMEYYSENGVPLPPEPAIDIYRFDLKNTSSVINLTSRNPNLSISNVGGSAQMLPNGLIVIAFGFNDIDGMMYPTDQVTLFDTTNNRIYNQSISGSPPEARVAASSALGPDKTTIYYYGGGADERVIFTSYEGQSVSKMAILDTKTWSWVDVPILGPSPIPFAHGTMTLFQNSKLIVATGKMADMYAGDIGVLINLPTSDDSINSSKLQWFTNNPEIDQASLRSESRGLSDGAIAGIVVACVLILAIILALLWKYVPSTKKIANYIQNEMIWNPRSGEPLWAETARLLVRFILLFLFLAFVAYVIYKSVNSPIAIQEIKTPTDRVLAPDVRFCYDGFNDTIPEDLFVLCRFRNGTDCSQFITPLDMSLHSPQYLDKLGSVTCFLFLPGPSFYILDDKYGYADSKSTKIQFYLFAPPTLSIMDAVIYVDMYAPGYDPNIDAYKLGNESIVNNLDRIQLRQWYSAEQSSNVVENSFILKQKVQTTASYTLIQKETLKPNDGWNYIGFSSNYDKSLTITSQFKDAPQNVSQITGGFPISQITIQPKSFTININREQKVFTLLNAFAQAGGVLGLFIALQTILFGFRPQSPWGIVHRWSFGNLKMKLTNRLASYFDRMGTPVPLVSPVSTRLSTVFRSTHPYGPVGGNVPSAAEEAMSQESRVQHVEERLQLMELLLKSYYLNDEVFRSLHQAVERGNQERRRSSFGGIKPKKETDSVLGDDHVNEEFELAQNGYKANEPSNTGIDRRPSGTVFTPPRDVYQPRLADSYDLNEHNNTFPKK